MNKFALIVAAAIAVCACSISEKSDGLYPDECDPNGNGNQSGSRVLTAGEWNDLENWDFWSDLIMRDDFKNYCKYWGFNTDGRIAVHVYAANDGRPATGAKVELYSGDAQAVCNRHRRYIYFPDR